MLERDVVKKIRNYLKDEGYLTFNVIECIPSGVPDMIVISPTGEHTYLEIKRPGGRTQPNQDYIINKLRTRNCRVYIVDSLERVKEIFS